jgi:hypothetical protein
VLGTLCCCVFLEDVPGLVRGNGGAFQALNQMEEQ